MRLILNEDSDDLKSRSTNFCLKSSTISLIKEYGQVEDNDTISIGIEFLRQKVTEIYGAHLYKENDAP